jgi:drug/metabolite transporter (DMT)-like permease
MLVLLCLIWGVTWPIMKIALEQIPPFSMRTLSAALGALTLGVMCLSTGRSLRIRGRRTWTHIIVSSFINIIAFSMLSAFAQLAAATSRVAILSYTMPVWSVAFAWIFLRERPSGTQTLALALCGIGLAILIYPLTHAGVPIGIVLAVSTGLTWGAGTVYLKWARIQADPMTTAFWQLAIAFVVIGISMLIVEGRLDLSHATSEGLYATLLVGVAGNGFAYGLWFAIVRRLPAMTASLGVLGSPVIGVVASMLILGDRPTSTDLMGFALILAACACVVLGPQQVARKAPEAV